MTSVDWKPDLLTAKVDTQVEAKPAETKKVNIVYFKILKTLSIYRKAILGIKFVILTEKIRLKILTPV